MYSYLVGMDRVVPAKRLRISVEAEPERQKTECHQSGSTSDQSEPEGEGTVQPSEGPCACGEEK